MVAIAEDFMGLSLGANVNDGPWSPITGGAGTGLIVDPAFAAGVRAVAWEGTTTYGGFQRSWTNQADVFVDFYWNGVLNSGTGTVYIAKITPDTDGVAGAELRVNSGKFQIRNGTSSVDISTMNADLDATYHRFRWRVNAGSSTQTLDIFKGANMHGATPDESMSGAYTQGNIGRLMLGSPANPNNTDVSAKYALININDAAFAAPWVGGGQLDTPTSFTFERTSGLRQAVANWAAVDGAESYDLEVEYLSGANPAVEADWSALDVFNIPTGTTKTLTNADGIEWGETYRARVIAKVT